jgi:hypothetical protein
MALDLSYAREVTDGQAWLLKSRKRYRERLILKGFCGI